LRVTVLYGGELVSIAGASKEAVELAEGSTLEDLLSRLKATHGRRLFEVAGEKLLVLVNGRSVSPSAASQVKLSDGDFVSILPPVHGGSLSI
jgi:MoaD family protein